MLSGLHCCTHRGSACQMIPEFSASRCPSLSTHQIDSTVAARLLQRTHPVTEHRARCNMHEPLTAAARSVQCARQEVCAGVGVQRAGAHVAGVAGGQRGGARRVGLPAAPGAAVHPGRAHQQVWCPCRRIWGELMGRTCKPLWESPLPSLQLPLWESCWYVGPGTCGSSAAALNVRPAGFVSSDALCRFVHLRERQVRCNLNPSARPSPRVRLTVRCGGGGRSLFKGVLKEVGVAHPAVLPPGQAAEVQGAATARRRARAAATTGPAAVCTAPAQLLGVGHLKRHCYFKLFAVCATAAALSACQSHRQLCRDTGRGEGGLGAEPRSQLQTPLHAEDATAGSVSLCTRSSCAS